MRKLRVPAHSRRYAPSSRRPPPKMLEPASPATVLLLVITITNFIFNLFNRTAERLSIIVRGPSGSTKTWSQPYRPSFDLVLKELEEIILEQCISDEKGRELWKEHSNGDDQMAWDELVRAVCPALGRPSDTYCSDRKIQCLKVRCSYPLFGQHF